MNEVEANLKRATFLQTQDFEFNPYWASIDEFGLPKFQNLRFPPWPSEHKPIWIVEVPKFAIPKSSIPSR